MPTATLHCDLSNTKTTTEPTIKLPIHAHQATNSALPNFMGTNIPGRLGDDERYTSCDCEGGNNEYRRWTAFILARTEVLAPLAAKG
jgi:hypothetical protein